MKLKEIVMATTLTAGIISAMADSPDFTWFVASKIVAVFLFVLFFILAEWERLAETTAGKKIGTFFEGIIDSVVDFCCFLVIDVVMFISMLICAVIVTPIAVGFVLWLIAGKVYKKIFS